ncbi:hypothetical protein [Microbacterium sp. NPDC089696]|uniref:hypothetical protein n=1 Tax=Microbacterium sp. NPDC089696 TaxID=3364199 RepID=UPI00380A6A2B
MTNTYESVERTEQEIQGAPVYGRGGGFWWASLSFGVGAALGALSALYTVEIAAFVLQSDTEKLVELNSLPARVALVVAVAAFIAFIGIALDVVHSSESPRVNLAVRCFALAAGTTAFIGSWLALPFALNTALTILVTTLLIAVIVGTLIVGVVLNSRKAKSSRARS